MTADRTDDELSGPCRDLYSADPETFMTVRSELAATARKDGDGALAKRIAALRKPTTSASIVNRHVLADPSVSKRLTQIGDRLRTAQNGPDGIDRDRLRELSTERRALVRDVSDAALEAFGTSAGASIRDEVVSTFDAAVADPDVTAQLGRLLRAQQWSGFGVVGDPPASGSKHSETGSKHSRTATKQSNTAPKQSKTVSKKSETEQELSAAEDELSAAEHDLSTACDEQQATTERVSELEAQLAELGKQVDVAQQAATKAREVVQVARARQRTAKSARDRAARRATRAAGRRSGH